MRAGNTRRSTGFVKKHESAAKALAESRASADSWLKSGASHLREDKVDDRALALETTARQRRAVVADEAALAAFEEANFRQDRISRRQWHYQLRRPTIEVWLDELAGESAPTLRGVLVLFFRQRSRVARIYSLAVAPKWRGRGIANALLGLAERRARARGCDRLSLEVRTDNEIALGLYRRAGFARLHTVRNYYEDGAAALRLEKYLPAIERGHRLAQAPAAGATSAPAVDSADPLPAL